MDREIVSDVIPPSRRKTDASNVPHRRKTPPSRRSGAPSASHTGIWMVAGVAVLVLLFLVFSFLFAGATVAVVPRQESAAVDGVFSAEKGATAVFMPFETITIAADASESVIATGEERVDTKASGTIVVYNNYSSASQRLIKNTRFETAEGKIFRIEESIVVPGRTQNASGATVPGSIEVTIYADTSGDSYNVGLADFTIPGFKGDPRYEHFYARGKTPMSGGFSGVLPSVAPGDLAAARDRIRETLRASLAESAASELPDDFILYKDSSMVTFESVPPERNGDDAVTVRERGTFFGVIFDERELARHIAENTIGSYDGGDVRGIGLPALTFAFANPAELNLQSLTSFDFTLEGPVHIVWTFDRARLADDLAGKEKSETETVLQGYSAIREAEVVIRPFWKRRFPESAKRIAIEESVVSDLVRAIDDER